MAFSDIETRAEITARQLVERLAQRHETLVLAESCTAGLASDLLARVSGASAVLWGSFVCYQAEAKERMLGINGTFLKRYGLVSGETAREMACRALDLADASVSAAVTGLAGPLGDGSGTPVGTVWVAVARRLGSEKTSVKELHFNGTRAEVRVLAAAALMDELLEALV